MTDALPLFSVMVNAQHEGQRLSDFPMNRYTEIIHSRKGFKKRIKAGKILVNQVIRSTAYRLNVGDVIALLGHDKEIQIWEQDIEVLFEDQYLAVVRKPPGMITSGYPSQTLRNCLPYNLAESPLVDALPQPHPVHRLDKSSAGLVMVAKSKAALIHLSKAFEAGLIEKHYRLICQGSIKAPMLMAFPLDGKTSKTEINISDPLEHPNLASISYVELQLHSGRKHQIRKHLSLLGHPLIGDQLYGNERGNKGGKGLFLQAFKLKFQHPFTKAIHRLQLELPNKFKTVIRHCSSNAHQI